MFHSRIVLIIIGFLFIIGLGFYFSWKDFGPLFSKKDTVASIIKTTEKGTAHLGEAFRLKDTSGVYRTDKEFHGKIMLIYFGYSYCPDICPTALSAMSKALQSLGKEVNHIQPLFITVDPKRDTQELLTTYMKDFDSHFIALIGTEEELSSLKKGYKVYAAKVPTSDPQDPHYLMDHTSLIYVMDPTGKYITHFSHQINPSLLAKHLKEILSHYFPT